MRNALGRAVPTHFQDPFGLAFRLWRSGSREARFAMASAAAALAATPLDLLMERAEARRLAAAVPPRLPLLFITGPPRSGTTLLTLALIRCLPVSYIDNLTAIFPRAPITAHEWFGRLQRRESIELDSFYGRTAGLVGPNDGLHLWDRWLGRDRTHVPGEISPAAGNAMAAFFGAFETALGGPVVAKNNNLIGCADLVAPWLPGARFLCLRRDPLFLAQSLLEARRMIHGDLGVSYGIDDPARHLGMDPVDDAVRQVGFYFQLEARQRAALGARFESISYECFCESPAEIVLRIARDSLRLDPSPEFVRQRLSVISPSKRRTLPPDVFERLERAVADAHWEAP